MHKDKVRKIHLFKDGYTDYNQMNARICGFYQTLQVTSLLGLILVWWDNVQILYFQNDSQILFLILRF